MIKKHIAIAIDGAKDPVDKYEISRHYQAHMKAISLDRQLETYFQDRPTCECLKCGRVKDN